MNESNRFPSKFANIFYENISANTAEYGLSDICYDLEICADIAYLLVSQCTGSELEGVVADIQRLLRVFSFELELLLVKVKQASAEIVEILIGIIELPDKLRMSMVAVEAARIEAIRIKITSWLKEPFLIDLKAILHGQDLTNARISQNVQLTQKVWQDGIESLYNSVDNFCTYISAGSRELEEFESISISELNIEQVLYRPMAPWYTINRLISEYLPTFSALSKRINRNCGSNTLTIEEARLRIESIKEKLRMKLSSKSKKV